MPDAGYLTIGKVVSKLQKQYPELSVSKVRYLEDEGLLNPSRTPGGYRLYSQHDINTLETILYLQKHRFLPLQVIKEELAKGDVSLAALREQGQEPAEPEASTQGARRQKPGAELIDELPANLTTPEVQEKFHPINQIPNLLGVSVSFVRELSDAGVIVTRMSPHGRLLVDGKDFQLIYTCEQLRRYGIGPRNLRQYVLAANRESGMFEQALTVYGTKGTGESEPSEERQQRYDEALDRMIALTNGVRETLIRRRIQDGEKGGGR